MLIFLVWSPDVFVSLDIEKTLKIQHVDEDSISVKGLLVLIQSNIGNMEYVLRVKSHILD